MNHIHIYNNAIPRAPPSAAVPMPDPVFPIRVPEAPWQTVPSETPPPPNHLSYTWHNSHGQSVRRWRIQHLTGDMILIELESMIRYKTRHIFRKRDVLSIMSKTWSGEGIPTGAYKDEEVVISLKKERDYPQRIKVTFCEAINAIEFQRQLVEAC